MEEIRITQMTSYELENLIERVLVKVLNKYVEKESYTERKKKNIVAADPNAKVLTFEQGCQYLGYATSYIYKLTSAGMIPFSKPNGKTIFFDRDELEEWMLQNKNTPLSKRKIEAATYVSTHP